MSFTALDESPVEQKNNIRDSIGHARCCKESVLKGLCGQDTPRDLIPGRKMSRRDCVVCLELWYGGHHAVCPRDSGLW